MDIHRRAAPVEKPVALTIAGSDSGGGAGIQADLKTMEANGVFGTSAVTSLTAQNSLGVNTTHPIPVDTIQAQIDAVCSDFDVRAVKTGMLGVTPVVEAITATASEIDAPFVVDPVMVAASGDRLLEPDAENAYHHLISQSTLVTPNADEAEVLTDVAIEDEASMYAAGEELVSIGADAALVKGGHVNSDDRIVRDVLVTGDENKTFEHARVDTDATHGSGCMLSSIITARLARDDDLMTAVGSGITQLSRAVRYPLDVGQGPGSVHHLVTLRERATRQQTQEQVEAIIKALTDVDARPIVPEVGLNVVGATPYAESPDEMAAIEGRITKTLSGVRPNRGTRFGASSHVARFLLAIREFDPTVRFAANIRFTDEIERSLKSLDGPAVEIDRTNEPAPDEEGSTMGWAARLAFQQIDGTPAAIFDRGDQGKEAMTRLIATDHQTLRDRALTLLEQITA